MMRTLTGFLKYHYKITKQKSGENLTFISNDNKIKTNSNLHLLQLEKPESYISNYAEGVFRPMIFPRSKSPWDSKDPTRLTRSTSKSKQITEKQNTAENSLQQQHVFQDTGVLVVIRPSCLGRGQWISSTNLSKSTFFWKVTTNKHYFSPSYS